ncbi:MAG: acetate--CoA ligase family protein, partial [Jatrophihabitantaceae bacterium]
TDVVLMYLESFGNPRKFARLTRRLGRRKPIIVINSGAGMVVPGLQESSVELPEVSAQALFEESGVIRVETVSGMFDVALLLTSQPLPTGDRVAVVGNSTALGVLVTNACRANGLSMARLEDVGVQGSAAAFEPALRAAVDDPGVDSVVVVFVPPLQRTAGQDVAEALRAVAATSAKPILSTFLGFEGMPEALAAEGESAPARGSVPSYPSPERAVRALARAVRYAAWRERPPSSVPQLDRIDLPAARALVEGVLAEGEGRTLSTEETGRLLGTVGIVLSYEAPAETVEVEYSVFDDHSFGALVSFGVGGVATALLGDTVYAAAPLTTDGAAELIAAPRAAPLLTGYQGSEPCDTAALADLALRLSALGDALPELAELTLAALAAPFGAQVTAASARVAPPSARGDSGPRRMRGL